MKPIKSLYLFKYPEGITNAVFQNKYFEYPSLDSSAALRENIDGCNRSNNVSCAVTSIIQIYCLKTIIVKTWIRKVLFQ